MSPDRQSDVAALPLRHLKLPHRAKAACAELGLVRVADGLACKEADFVAVRGCGPKTFLAFRAQLEALVDDPLPDVDFAAADTAAFDAPLGLRAGSGSCVPALKSASITTLGQLLATPVAALEALPDVSLQEVQRLLADHAFEMDRPEQSSPSPTGAPSAPTSAADREACAAQTQSQPPERAAQNHTAAGLAEILPDTLLGASPERLLLRDSARRALRDANVHTLGAVFASEPTSLGLSTDDVCALRFELDRIFRLGADTVEAIERNRARRSNSLVQRLIAHLAPADFEYVARRIGLHHPPESDLQIAAKTGVPRADLKAQTRRIVAWLQSEFALTLDRLCASIDAALAAHDDVLICPMQPGDRARRRVSGPETLALRFIAFAFSQRYHFRGPLFTCLPAHAAQALATGLDRACRRARLPQPLDKILADLPDRGTPAHGTLTQLLLRHELGYTIRIDSKLGEVVTTSSSTVPDRLQSLIEDRAAPVPLDELLFDYREQFRRSSRSKLWDHLRHDSRFLEVGPQVWSLRDRHLDELEFVRPEADRVSQIIRTARGRHGVASLAEGAPYTVRQLHLLVDVLRNDPSLRDLGRQEFTPRYQEMSEVMMTLTQDLARAMGEIPISRFLGNQPEHRKRLVRTLIRRNRMFLSPTPDRIDLLTNYPFDEDRIRRLLVIADQCIEQHAGYSTLEEVQGAAREVGLGGAFLTEHLLQDILSRHGHFEFLPGGILAHASLGLSGWIQRKAREVLRACGTALTPDQVLMERPELAEFSDCLVDLMERDPMLLCQEDGRFQVT